MTALAAAIRIVAAAMVLMGGLWIGQGLGLVHWPSWSVMLDQRPWAMRGVALVLAGGGLWLASRRLTRH